MDKELSKWVDINEEKKVDEEEKDED